MVQFKSIVCVSTLASLAAAVAVPVNHVLHEKRHIPSNLWVKRDRIAADAVLPMRIGLRQGNLDTLYDRLMDVSHPESANYSKHWTQEEVIAHFAPAKETVESVRQWLTDSGIAHHRIVHHDNKGWLALDVTGKEIEELLKTEFYEHDHVFKEGKVAVGCDQYHVPTHITEHIDYITPGVKHIGVRKRELKEKRQVARPGVSSAALGLPGRGSPMQTLPPPDVVLSMKLKGDLANCDKAVTPACVAAIYQIPEPGNTAQPGNQMAVFEEGDYFSETDLNLFFANFTSRIPEGTEPNVKSIDGGHAPVNASMAGGESDLDIELAYPIIYPQKLWVYQVDDINYATGVLQAGGFGNTFFDALDGSYCDYTAFNETGNDPTLDPSYPDPLPGGWHHKLQCGVYRPATVISISYGEQENQLPAGYQERQCNEMGKLGLQGVSIFGASGDYGVAGPGLSSVPYAGCIGPNGTAFSPTNPNSCPYMTNVGATQIPINGTIHDKEVAVYSQGRRTLFTSGGGFSNIYPIPTWQQSSVKHYFRNNKLPFPSYDGGGNIGKNGGVYNRKGRGIPDVAALGLNIALFVRGRYTLEGGTSASSPLFAAIITRINEERLLIGKNVLGYINPSIYSNPSMFNDITSGFAAGCNTTGFPAAKGWDPVTGLGTPNYPKMLAYFLTLP